MTENNFHPQKILLHKKSKILEIMFNTEESFKLPCEYLRVYSPSADVKGHGPGQEVLQLGKEKVNINKIEPIGNYAVRLIFDDGHETGLYSWNYLYELGKNQAINWKNYITAIKNAGYQRKEDD